ncbi:MAG: YdcF family protein [Ignavibacteriales bacterium]|nr:YdcF family protein [Ignavibacteriales bacterium]
MRYNWSNIKGALLVAIIFLSVLAVDIGGVFWYYRHVLRFLGDQPEISKADAAVVFFGDYLENGELGPDSKKRAQATFDLYKNNSVNFIICVGGYDYRNWKGRPHAMKNYLCKLGVPSSKI